MLGEYLYPLVFKLQANDSDILPSSEKRTDTCSNPAFVFSVDFQHYLAGGKANWDVFGDG